MQVRPFVHSLLGRARGIGIDDEHEHVGGFARVVCHGASPEPSAVADDAVAALPEPQVAAKPTRRRFTAEYKRRILKAADGLREPGQIGALLRREGLYSSLLSRWRAQRDQGVLNALAPKRRGRKPELRRAELVRLAELERENRTLRAQLQQAELIIDVQKESRLCWA